MGILQYCVKNALFLKFLESSRGAGSACFQIFSFEKSTFQKCRFQDIFQIETPFSNSKIQNWVFYTWWGTLLRETPFLRTIVDFQKNSKKSCFEKISDSLAERPDLLLLWDALIKESHVFPELASIASKNLKSQQESADGFKLFRKHKTWKTFRSDIDAFFDGMYAMERILPIFRK